MHRFSATVTSDGVVDADPGEVWAVLVDPDALVAMTPLLASIEADGDDWRWHMRSVGALGLSVRPVFTERMAFAEPDRIDFTHSPPDGAREWTGVTGSYTLTPEGDGTRLAIEVTVEIELPLHGAAAPAVRRAMRSTMTMMGERFAANLEKRLAA